MCPLYHFAGFVGRERSRPVQRSWWRRPGETEGDRSAVQLLILSDQDQHETARNPTKAGQDILFLLEIRQSAIPQLDEERKEGLVDLS